MAQAATFSVTFDQDSTPGNALGTFLTLNFGNGIDNDTVFVNADLVSRVWTDLHLFGPANLTNNHGLYPVANLANTTPAITGTVSATMTPLNIGFSYIETDATLGFVPFDFDRILNIRMRGPALWTAIDGFTPNFYVDSISYDATGTAEDFRAVETPAPAALPLLLTGLCLFGIARRIRS